MLRCSGGLSTPPGGVIHSTIADFRLRVSSERALAAPRVIYTEEHTSEPPGSQYEQKTAYHICYVK